jgi:uncharacterized membrane protein
MTLALKALHLATLLVWCAALLALPLMLKWPRSGPAGGKHDALRRLLQATYTRLATPAAVIAIAAGTALLFAAKAFEPWMFAKLVAVALLVALHVRIGLVLEHLGQAAAPGHQPVDAAARERAAAQALARAPVRLALWLALGAALAMALVLLLVLAKPAPPAGLWPHWLLTPRHQPMPVAEPPKR